MRSRWTRGPARPGRGRSVKRGQGGFTLVETLVALTILGLALAPLLGSVSAGVRAQGRLRPTVDAVALADLRMTELSLLPVDSVAAYLQPREGWFAEPFAGYRWRALLRAEPQSPALVRAAVVVQWKDGSYSLETVFHRPEMLPEFSPTQ